MTRLTDLHTAATNTARGVWDRLGAPIMELWGTTADMPLPVALATVYAALALGKAAADHHWKGHV